jgi:hypothetical protein
VNGLQTDFERARLEVAGRGVTITSWYEPDKQRWRANAPTLNHLMAGEEVITGATRASAIRAAAAYLAQRLTIPSGPSR